MTVSCIVQARMTSKRFPGKVVAPLNGVPVLQRVLSRVKLIKDVDKVVCAFPEDPASKPILDICREMRVIAFAGSEADVLRRYYEAAKHVSAKWIMRVTADCPFIDPLVCHDVLEAAIATDCDYASNVFPVRSFPKGLDCEVFGYDCLEAAYLNAVEDYDREHVTPWMQRTPGLDRISAIAKKPDPDLNLCVDEPGDIKRLEAMRELY